MAITLGLLLICFVLVSLLDLPHLIKQKRKKEAAVYTVMLAAAYTLFNFHFLHIRLWGPNQLVTTIVRFLSP